jgi:mannose-6-phosphate isomerase-like protein (cupin superfamily)
MKALEFPDLIRNLPQADLPVDGLTGWLLQSGDGQVLFMECTVQVNIPEHSHGDQWGIVVKGKIDLTINGQAKTYSTGDSYFIPAGILHKAALYPGFRALDFFADKDRYHAK